MVADDELGLSFKNKHDRQTISVDPWATPGHKHRVPIEDPQYKQVVIFDFHIVPHSEIQSSRRG